MITKDVHIGDNTIIFHPELVNFYGCRIGNNCKIAAFVEIQKNVKIGNNVKIEPFVFIPEGVVIEDNVFIGPHTTFTNDRYPKATNPDGTLKNHSDWTVTKTTIKKGASIGANCTILPGVTIGSHALVGAGSVVSHNIPDHTLSYGNPVKAVKKI